MKKTFYLLILSALILFPFSIFADIESSDVSLNSDTKIEQSTELEKIEREQRSVLAMTNVNYPATPGDVYSISYIQAGEAVNFNSVVNSDYSVNLGFFGTVSGKGKTFVELNDDITNKITWAFPESYPNVVILSTGSFEISITGEVKRSRLVNIWGLTRLSDIVAENATRYSSIRDIEVISPDNTSTSYDLYDAWYFGKLKENPLIAPGSVINFKQINRNVTISGEVKRPGSFQLKEGENLSALITRYANNFTDQAYTDKIIVHHSTSDKSASGGDTEYIDFSTDSDTILLNGDVITVRSKKIFFPIFYIEGAAGLANGQLSGDALTTSNTIPINFQPNTRLSTVLLANKHLFSETSDLENSYFVDASDNSMKSINVSKIIYEYNLTEDVVVGSGDRLIIPFKQRFVTVNGAVEEPGRYPYVPDKNYNYYINLAGGFDTFRNNKGVVSIYNVDNEKVNNDRLIEKEDVITAETNSIGYTITEYSSLITAIASISGIIISIISLVQ